MMGSIIMMICAFFMKSIAAAAGRSDDQAGDAAHFEWPARHARDDAKMENINNSA